MYRQKMCGPVERILDFVYKEGCEKQNHPFKREVCYCKTNLCNHCNALGWNHLLYIYYTFTISYLQ